MKTLQATNNISLVVYNDKFARENSRENSRENLKQEAEKILENTVKRYYQFYASQSETWQIAFDMAVLALLEQLKQGKIIKTHWESEKNMYNYIGKCILNNFSHLTKKNNQQHDFDPELCPNWVFGGSTLYQTDSKQSFFDIIQTVLSAIDDELTKSIFILKGIWGHTEREIVERTTLSYSMQVNRKIKYIRNKLKTLAL